MSEELKRFLKFLEEAENSQLASVTYHQDARIHKCSIADISAAKQACNKLQSRLAAAEKKISAYRNCSKDHKENCPDVRCWVQELRDELHDEIENLHAKITELRKALEEILSKATVNPLNQDATNLNMAEIKHITEQALKKETKGGEVPTCIACVKKECEFQGTNKSSCIGYYTGKAI